MPVVVNAQDKETLVGRAFVGLHSDVVFIVIEANDANFVVSPVNTSRNTLGFLTSLPYGYEFDKAVAASTIWVTYPEAWAIFKAEYNGVALKMEESSG